MKNRFLSFLLIATMLFSLGYGVATRAADRDVRTAAIEVIKAGAMKIAAEPETDEQAQASWDRFNKFAKDNGLKGGYQHPEENIWSLAFFVANNPDVPKWVVYGFPTLTEAVDQIIADYAAFPKGNVRTYKQKSASNQLRVSN